MYYILKIFKTIISKNLIYNNNSLLYKNNIKNIFSYKFKSINTYIYNNFNYELVAEKQKTKKANKIKLLIQIIISFMKHIFKKYIYTINHKRIAINYFFFSFWSGCCGATLATMMRLELATPGSPYFKGDSLRYLQVITAHGLIMIFFVVVPILFGGFANFLIPYHIGSKDVAFPRLNSIGFWILPCGFLLVAKIAFLRTQYWRYYDKVSYILPFYEKVSKKQLNNYIASNYTTINFFTKDNFINFLFFWKPRKKIEIEGYNVFSFIPLNLLLYKYFHIYPESLYWAISEITRVRRKKIYFSKCSNRTLTTAGWAFMTPLSSNTKFTGIGSQDILIVSVIFAGVSTTISFTNLLITKRTLTMPGLRNRKNLLPFVTISILLTLRMLLLITPVLAAGMIMLLLDRHWQTTFFEFAYGGDVVLFQHLFWFFGHPEVYVLIIPTFGFVNMILPYGNTRRIASKHHLVWAIYIMAYMGFVVWGHHMYLVGLDHRSRSLYSTITIMISLPATIKMVNWTLTLLNGGFKIDTAMLFSIAYIVVFVVGGFTGMWLSHVGLNISMHDTYYVVAHFHLMLSGATMIGIFAGFYYYFVAFFGIKYSNFFSHLHLIYYVGGQWLTFLPMFWLGFSGLPRRIHDYPVMFMGWQNMATIGHFITLTGILFFFLMIFDSHYERKIHIPSTLGVPRWYKRIQYYFFKISYMNQAEKDSKNYINYKTQQLLFNTSIV